MLRLYHIPSDGVDIDGHSSVRPSTVNQGNPSDPARRGRRRQRDCAIAAAIPELFPGQRRTVAAALRRLAAHQPSAGLPGGMAPGWPLTLDPTAAKLVSRAWNRAFYDAMPHLDPAAVRRGAEMADRLDLAALGRRDLLRLLRRLRAEEADARRRGNGGAYLAGCERRREQAEVRLTFLNLGRKRTEGGR